MTLLVLLAALALAIAGTYYARRAIGALRSGQPILWQFGRFTNTRLGIHGHAVWSDEPEVVEYDDWRWWIRVKPNPGINLPVLGYWSRANGRKR